MTSFSKPQQQYIAAFSKESGLDPGVVSAWVAAEEPVGATARVGASRVGAAQDWLNIGITDSGPRGAGNVNWNDPVSAGTYGAKWLKGQVSIPGFGTASSGIQNIAKTAGQSPAAQIAAIKNSGWASGGYPDFESIYNTYKGNAPAINTAALASVANQRATSATPQPTTQTATTPPKTDYRAAGINALLTSANRKIDTSGKFTASKLVGSILNNIASGAYTTPGQTTTTNAPSTSQSLSQIATQKAAAPSRTAESGVQKILSMAQAAVGGPYSQANHGDIFGKSAAWLKANGTDCSGFVSWLMGPDGLGLWKSALATPDIPNAPGIQKGKGSAITIWNNPLPGNSGHVFININGQFFQSAGGGTGIQPISASAAASMIKNGDNGAPYYPLHPKGY